MNSPNPSVPEWFSRMYREDRAQLAAQMQIVDEARYSDVMLSDPDRSVRRAAIKRITDQALLRQAALQDPKETVRLAAVEKLSDQNLLFSIAFHDKSDAVRRSAGRALREDVLCFRTAMEHPDFSIRFQAADNLKNQQLLARLLAETDQKELQVHAVLRISDPVLAEKLFRELPPDHESFSTPRSLLVHAVRNQQLLAELALHDPDFKVRRAAASGLTDQALLIQIIGDETEYDRVRAAAAGQITDQAVLQKLANQYSHKLAPYDIGEEALKHITDQEYLKSFAEDTGLMHCLREAAAGQVTNQEILLEWALNESGSTLHDIGLAGIAVRQLRTPEYLAKAAVRRVNDSDLSERAIERLHDDRWLLWVIRELREHEDAGNWWIRSLLCTAADNVQDPSLLVEPALQECNDEMDIVESFELECIRCIAESPSAMHDYAARFTNPEAKTMAVDFTWSRYGLEGFLKNPIIDEAGRNTVREKIRRLDHLGEIGMAEPGRSSAEFRTDVP